VAGSEVPRERKMAAERRPIWAERRILSAFFEFFISSLNL
jgi:hypothetical protein